MDDFTSFFRRMTLNNYIFSGLDEIIVEEIIGDDLDKENKKSWNVLVFSVMKTFSDMINSRGSFRELVRENVKNYDHDVWVSIWAGVFENYCKEYKFPSEKQGIVLSRIAEVSLAVQDLFAKNNRFKMNFYLRIVPVTRR